MDKISGGTWIPLGALVIVSIVVLYVGRFGWQSDANAAAIKDIKQDQIRDRAEYLQSVKDLNTKFDLYFVNHRGH